MNAAYLFLILFLLQTSLYSQDINLSGSYFIISTTGLNLRSSPNTQSKILTKIPFGEKIEVTSNKSYGLDTIGVNKFHNVQHNEFTESIISGNWVKVDYKGKIGFLFDAYIYRYYERWDDILYNYATPNINQNFSILFPGTWCNYNFWYNKNHYWYGCYKIGDKFKLRVIDLSFYKDWNGELTDIGISSNNNENLIFIIGSNKKLNQSLISGIYNPNWWSRSFENIKNIEYKNENNVTKLILSSELKTQTLNFYRNRFYNPSSIIWQGDLDKDNKLDYIIHYGGKSGNTFLYLSSEAEKDQIVKPVAVFFSGYCC